MDAERFCKRHMLYRPFMTLVFSDAVTAMLIRVVDEILLGWYL